MNNLNRLSNNLNMDSIFNQIFTHVVNSEVAELTSLPEFIQLTQQDNPVSNTPEFLKLLLILERVIKTSAHIVRVSNLEEREARLSLKEDRTDSFDSSSEESDSSVTETERDTKNILDSDNESSRTQGVFFTDKTGETIKDRLNKVFVDSFMNSGTVLMLANDMEEAFTVVDYERRGNYILYYSPLDSVFNVFCGTSCGSIFSFTCRAQYFHNESLSMEEALLPGECIDIAGYAIYGCSTVLTLGIKNGGVHQFTLDSNLGLFILTARDIQVPRKATSYTINESSSRKWSQVLATFLSKKKAEKVLD